MKRWYIHGTSYESGLKIREEGFKQQARIWDCSDYDTLYLRCLCECLPDGTKPDDLGYEFIDCIRDTIYNACAAAAFQDSKDERITFLLICLDDDEILEDSSCSNMEFCYQIPYKELEGKEILMTMMEVYDPKFRVMFFPRHEHFNLDECDLSENERIWISMSEESRDFDFVNEIIEHSINLNRTQFEVMQDQFKDEY